MPRHANSCSPTDPRHRAPATSQGLRRVLLAGLLLGGSLTLVGCDGTGADTGLDEAPTAEVTRGPLRISVLEGGDLESANPLSIRSQVEGRAAITYLIPEGTYVEEGTVLCRMDSSGIEDRLNDQEIGLERARSDLVQAQEALAIQKKRNEEDELRARTDLTLAENALTAYTEGKYLIEKLDLEAQITLKEAQKKQAEEVAAASERLFAKNFIPKTELDRDLLDAQRATQEVDIAKRKLRQLEEWDKQDQITRLQTDVEVRRLALERTKKQGDSELAQKRDTVDTRKRNFDIEVEKRDKLAEQLEFCTIHSPNPGLVVYAKRGGRRGDQEPVEVGTEMREREEILRLPDLRDLVVEVDIHESKIKQVERGQRAWVTVDALPGKTFPGTVISVGLVPSSQSSWMNPDLKVYTTRVRLDEVADGLKPGMHSQVQIMVAEKESAMQVPLLAIQSSGERTFAYVDRGAGQKPELREVEVGHANDSHIEILGGLKEGERVFLARPTDGDPLPEPLEREFLEEVPGEGGAPGSGRPRPIDDGNLPTGGSRGERGAAGPGSRGERGGEAPASRGGGEAPGERGEGARPGGGAGMSDAMRERFKNMSPEERKALMDRMRRARGGEGGDAPGGGNRGDG